MKISAAELNSLKQVQALLAEISVIVPPLPSLPMEPFHITKYSVILKLKAMFETLKDTPLDPTRDYISHNVKKQFPTVDWANMRIMRNYLVHCYFLIEELDLLQICQHFVPQLFAQITAVLGCINERRDIDSAKAADIPSLEYPISNYQVYIKIKLYVDQSPLRQANGASQTRSLLDLAKEMLTCARSIVDIFGADIMPVQIQKEAAQNCLEIYGEVCNALFAYSEGGSAEAKQLMNITNQFKGISVMHCRAYRSVSAHELALLGLDILMQCRTSMSAPLFQAELEVYICRLETADSFDDTAREKLQRRFTYEVQFFEAA